MQLAINCHAQLTRGTYLIATSGRNFSKFAFGEFSDRPRNMNGSIGLEFLHD